MDIDILVMNVKHYNNYNISMKKHLKHRNVKNIYIKLKRRTTVAIMNTVQTVVKYVGSFQMLERTVFIIATVVTRFSSICILYIYSF
jgi:hypothetical protein